MSMGDSGLSREQSIAATMCRSAHRVHTAEPRLKGLSQLCHALGIKTQRPMKLVLITANLTVTNQSWFSFKKQVSKAKPAQFLCVVLKMQHGHHPSMMIGGAFPCTHICKHIHTTASSIADRCVHTYSLEERRPVLFTLVEMKVPLALRQSNPKKQVKQKNGGKLLSSPTTAVPFCAQFTLWHVYASIRWRSHLDKSKE